MTEIDKKTVKKNKWKNLRLSLKYRPKIMQLILKMRQCIRRRNAEIKSLNSRLKKYGATEKPIKTEASTQTIDALQKSKEFENASIQTLEEKSKVGILENLTQNEEKSPDMKEPNKANEECKTKTDAGWNIGDSSGEKEKSIAEQVKEVAQSAMQQSGMVYVESAGMYYDYKTGYYYNSELGLYYHPDTGCYYYYSDEKQQFVFHSYPDTSAVNTSLIAHQKKKARKQLKRERKPDEDIDNLTKTLSQDNEETKKAKRRKIKAKKNGQSEKENKAQNSKKDSKLKKKERMMKDSKPKENSTDIFENSDGKEYGETINKDGKVMNIDNESKNSAESQMDVSKEEQVSNEGEVSNNGEVPEDGEVSEEGEVVKEELEDGECSESSSEEEDDVSSNASTSTVSDEDSVAKHHPPCMRVIVRETDLPKLKVGSLFLVTKDGGTIGREGEHHTILIRDTNVSRNHLDVRYDMQRRTYVATDLGSKNGTILNGNRMSESSEVSSPMDILHGSTIQLGETKLLCHIHPGNDTCGHCEPGLLMESEEKEKKTAYTRTCSVKKQHELELARLKNIYAPKLLQIEEKPYNDRAQARRETVGSSHHSVKTETTDLDTSISTENKGFKLLQKMGWSKGEGLGKDGQGDTEPVPLVSNEGKSGLGTGAVAPPSIRPASRPKNTISSATMRLATRTKMLQPPAKAFQDNEDGEESE